MQRDAPLDPVAPDAGHEPERSKALSRRSTLVTGLAMAALLAVAAWYVGGRAGFDQIGQGGTNLGLLPKVGQPAPDFFVGLTDGRLVRLAEFRGQPVWLNFWGSWCPPCRAEMPEMQAAHEELAPRGLVILAVSLDEPARQAADFAALNEVTFLVASDPRRVATGGSYPIFNFPTHILVDKDGTIRDVVLSELDKGEIVQKAQRILPSGG